MAAPDYYRPPADAEIDVAEARLQFPFPREYREFLKTGGDVGNALFEPALVLPGSGHLDLCEIAETAWGAIGVPRNRLPFIEDNGDYFCLTPEGEILYWSHNGSSNERWPSFESWYRQVCIERR
ncbi:SMI1/KNR4 family protein [Ramlibacter sp. AN1133]|uniref:SMI1/KNR4 family protein n=1 Tax=Ramlibacter sp. AN1133 TaxID=3133429 RepID=UPI0040409F48